MAKKKGPDEEFSKKEINEWVVKADHPFLDRLFLSLDKEYSKTLSLNDKRSKVAEIALSDSTVAQLLKDYFYIVEQSKRDIKEFKTELEKAKAQYKNAKETLYTAKTAFETKKDTFLNSSIQLTDAQQEILQQLEADKQKQLEKAQAEKEEKLRKEIKKKALIEYCKGLAVAAIENRQQEYIDATQKMSDDIIMGAKAVIHNLVTAQGINPYSVEGIEVVVKSVLETPERKNFYGVLDLLPLSSEEESFTKNDSKKPVGLR